MRKCELMRCAKWENRDGVKEKHFEKTAGERVLY